MGISSGDAVLALVSFLCGLIATALFTRGALLREQIDAIIGRLDKLEEISIEYWSMDGNSSVDPKFESIIKSIPFVIAEFDDVAKSKFGGFYREYDAILLAIIEETSSGDFETSSRKADLQRVFRIQRLISKLRMMLRRVKYLELRIVRSLEEFAYDLADSNPSILGRILHFFGLRYRSE